MIEFIIAYLAVGIGVGIWLVGFRDRKLTEVPRLDWLKFGILALLWFPIGVVLVLVMFVVMIFIILIFLTY